MSEIGEITAVYYTANQISPQFQNRMFTELMSSVSKAGAEMIVVSQEPMIVPCRNIVVDMEPSHINIYRQALVGAKAATTPYIALVEDDVLYAPEHFKHRPSNDDVFAYNLSAWNIFTWGEPILSHKGTVRKNLNSLICDRELFIQAMEERFKKHPDGTDPAIWAEPGRYERHLGVTERHTETFYTNPPNIIFSHQKAISFGTLGERKRLGEYRALEIPYWGKAEEIRRLYE